MFCPHARAGASGQAGKRVSACKKQGAQRVYASAQLGEPRAATARVEHRLLRWVAAGWIDVQHAGWAGVHTWFSG